MAYPRQGQTGATALLQPLTRAHTPVPAGCSSPKAPTVGAVTPVWRSEIAAHYETVHQGGLL